MSHICKLGKGRRQCHDISELFSNKEEDVIACSSLSDSGENEKVKGSTQFPPDLISRSRFLNRPFYRYGGHIELIRFKEDAQESLAQ